MLKYLPNAITGMRLLLALPLGWLILDQDYRGALVVGAIAGASDALDGYAARRLQHFSRLGAMLDPVADKLLVTVAFLCFAHSGLTSWTVAAVVIGRDLVIVSGAAAYRLLVGPFTFAATSLSKFNMFIQIAYCILLLAVQLLGADAARLVQGATVLLVLAALLSGLDYVITWSVKAIRARREKET